MLIEGAFVFHACGLLLVPNINPKGLPRLSSRILGYYRKIQKTKRREGC